ncbi:hypothetical protein [Luteolibacter sp. Populi]|uniref:hypothetical protein n=1 Tax=Luteolibacter sp. Populi TaxID=3230487 RepID=UPI00346699A0
METDIYVREAEKGITLLMGAEIIDTWEDGCLVRSEEKLPAGGHYYVEEGDQLVALSLPPPRQDRGPYDYAAQKDRSDIRPVPSLAR